MRAWLRRTIPEHIAMDVIAFCLAALCLAVAYTVRP